MSKSPLVYRVTHDGNYYSICKLNGDVVLSRFADLRIMDKCANEFLSGEELDAAQRAITEYYAQVAT